MFILKSNITMHLNRSHAFIKAVLLLFTSLVINKSNAQVTAIYSDYGGFWTSSATSINAVKPNNSHNMLAFTWNGTTFSTGVNDAALTLNSVAFTPLNFRAFPINTVPATAGGSYFVMLGQLYDGINNGVDNSPLTPFVANPTGSQLAGFLTDGIKGLNLGTGLANIPAGSTLRFDLSANGISASAINDGKPDIFMTEMASPSSVSPDKLKFVDASGVTVGTEITIDQGALTAIANWDADFYDLNSTQAISTYINQPRQMRFYAVDIATLGITAANYQSAVALVYTPNGTSDPAFIAFNEPAISVATQLTLTAQPVSYQNNITLPAAMVTQVRDGLAQAIHQSGIPVTAYIQLGNGVLSGTTTINTDVNGIATFSDLKISGSGIQKLKFVSASLDIAFSSNLADLSALPLTWQSFTIQKQAGNVQLNWQTVFEQNTKDFSIQHSVNGSDWSTIGVVQAAGRAGNYSFIHTSPAQGNNYYRLLQTDIDGNSTYSSTQEISIDNQNETIKVLVNPVKNDQLNLLLSKTAAVSILTTDGKLVWQKQLAPGKQQVEVSGLAAGVYILKSATVTKRIIITRR